MTRHRFAGLLGRALAALRDFLRGFVGIAGAGGPLSDAQPGEGDAATPESVRSALAERAERRKNCC